MQQTVEKLYAGTADHVDVYTALGWEVRPHGRWWAGLSRRGQNGMQSLSPVTRDVSDALHLVRHDKREEAMHAAMSLNRPLADGEGCKVARRVCIVALTREDLRDPRALAWQ